MKNLLIITQKVDAQDQLLAFFIPWIRRFASRFSQVHIICLEQGQADLPENVHIHSLGKNAGASKLGQLIRFYSLTYSLRHSYDSVFVHMNPIWVVLGGAWWHLLGKQVYLWYTHKAVTLKLRIAEYFADTIFTASQESFRLPSRKVIVTGHGIDTDLFSPGVSQKDGLSILTVGRIAPVKNYEVLIDAIQHLDDQPLSVTIVGEAALAQDQRYEERLKEKIQRENLSRRFSFVGKVQNEALVSIYQTHNLFVHMSKTGSLDKALLEAMACGMQVVSSNDAARAFLPEELIFRENDSRDLSHKIRWAFAHPASAELRKYVIENHNLDRLITSISNTISNG